MHKFKVAQIPSSRAVYSRHSYVPCLIEMSLGICTSERCVCVCVCVYVICVCVCVCSLVSTCVCLCVLHLVPDPSNFTL